MSRHNRFPNLSRAILLLLIAFSCAASHAVDYKYLVFIGTYTGNGSQGIYAYRFDPASGKLSPVGLVAATENPSFLVADPKGRFLYAVNELETFNGAKTGAVSAFAIDHDSGKLRFMQQVSSLGAAPAHLSLDRTDRYLLVANYNGRNVAVFPIKDSGELGPRSALEQRTGSSINPERQAGPHPHSILTSNDNRFALGADLGTDQLLVYRFDARNGSLSPNDPPFTRIKPGSGPRHFAFAPSGRFVYLANEMASTVEVFSYNKDSGTLSSKQTISTLPKTFTGKNEVAEIVVDAKGRSLYVSNRGDDSISVFGINKGWHSVIREARRERRQSATQLRARSNRQMVVSSESGIQQPSIVSG
jgi:6-phosphogluconolactonase